MSSAEEKRDKLEKLDGLLLDKLTDLLNKDDYESIKSLGTVATYLKNNQVITPPKKNKGMADKVKDALK